MTDIKRYTLKEFNNVTFCGFDYKLDPTIIKLISELALQVGSPDYIKTPVFTKKENLGVATTYGSNVKDTIQYGKKKKPNRNMEMVSDNDWETLRTFQTTKMEEKTGIAGYIDNIRTNLNKLSDKNVSEISIKIISDIDKIIEENATKEEIYNISSIIFDIASLNRFYSEIYAELYSSLINKYEIMRTTFETNLNNFMDLFNNIEYVDSSVDYDKFCKINKNNEKRKSLAAFFRNLSRRKIIPTKQIIEITKNLLTMINRFISEDNKKNEVDELIENVGILYDKTLISEYNKIMVVDNYNINDIIKKISQSKVKEYKSLTNKTIFKCMDLLDA